MSCGKGSPNEPANTGFPDTYVPPNATFDPPNERDPFKDILNIPLPEPYWVLALEMDDHESHIAPILKQYDRVIEYTFPIRRPDYDHPDISNYEPATNDVQIAVREILGKVETVLNLSFEEGESPNSLNVISVGLSDQSETAGFSYLPNIFFELGMDVFISTEFASPRFINSSRTNYDYEVLVHEIGHALGLKHPFEAAGANSAVLSDYEDTTEHTAMSYDESVVTFDGTFRSLDWMTLTKFYGVNASYNETDDVYFFSSSDGVFIVDGNGTDTISALPASSDAMIDLRPGAHSYLGTKSTFITSPNQLTISYGSSIENVITGQGDDTVIGTDLDNVITTGAGSDTIFAGGGIDVINSGSESDKIDLSEDIQARDVVIINTTDKEEDFDIIYGFVQGPMGDILEVSKIMSSPPEIFPLVALGNAPIANFSDGLLRVTGMNLESTSGIMAAFEDTAGLASLSISAGASSLVMSAASQETGIDQFLFHAESHGQDIALTQLAVFKGNTLDIDQWHADNLSFIA